uniref:Uncharacterized protein n=1 Tax=Babesia bovis TaxID=5865 RepID=S6BGM9_BABBO|nr:hypothetical protein [Babesia bovis]
MRKRVSATFTSFFVSSKVNSCILSLCDTHLMKPWQQATLPLPTPIPSFILIHSWSPNTLVKSPLTRAMYTFRNLLLRIPSQNSEAALLLLARIMTPDVSLSSRCTGYRVLALSLKTSFFRTSTSVL